MELVAPMELETRLRQGVVADGGTGMPLSQVGSMGSNLIGNDTRAYIIFIRQGQMLLGGYVAEHGGSQPGYLRTTDGTGNMVVARSNIGNDRSEGIKGCLVTLLQLALHVLLDFMHGHMTGTLDKGLHVLVPSTGNQLAHGVEFGKLGGIVGIGCTTWAQAIAQRQGYIVPGHNIADIIKVLIQKTLLIVQQAPLTHNATATTHDTAQSAISQVHVVATDASMDGKVIHTLLALFYEGIAIHLPREVLNLAIHLFQSLIDGHGAYGYRTVTQDPLAGFVNVVTCREVHQRIATPLARPYGFIHLLIDAGCGGRVTDVGIDFHRKVASDNHRLALGVMDVSGDNGTSASHFLTYILGGDMTLDTQCLTVHVFANGHILHLGSDDASLGTRHLGDALPPLSTVGYPLLAHGWQSLLQVNRIVGVGIRTAGIVDIYWCVGLHVWHALLVAGNGGC